MPIIVAGDITPENIAVELGRPTPATDSAEYAQWSKWIEDAKFLIRNRLGDTSLLDQEALGYVIIAAVAAHVRKPDDATQVDVAVDDGRVSRRYSSSAGRITILDEWWDLLQPAAEQGAFTITPFSEPDAAPDTYTTTPFSGWY